MTTVFLRSFNFDNSACIRKPILPEGTIHAWALHTDEVERFCTMYPKMCEVKHPEGYDLFAIDFNELDDYLTGEHDDMPPLLSFDSTKHTVNIMRAYYQVVFIPK